MPTLWRVFPWDRSAEAGAPFSASYVPPTTGRGRFDLTIDRSPVLYLAETPEHAVAEALQPWRNRPLRAAHLVRAGHPLALARFELPDRVARGVADLCDPDTLLRLGVAPDRIASRHRHVTQPIAQGVWTADHAGLRWWSAFWGDWHTTVLFTARLGGRLRLDAPLPLTVDAEAVRVAARALGMLGAS